MKRQERLREEIVAEYLAGGTSYRELEARYGCSCSTIHRWVQRADREKGTKSGELEKGELDTRLAREPIPAEMRRLEAELRKERLHNKLLNAMIDIAEEEMGVPIRKKPGAKQ